jgi:hypothetical protein
MNLELTFHADPAHGWAQVPRAIITELGIEKDISHYSYIDNHSVYLEEDCDLSLFMHKAKEKGWNVSFKEKHTNHDSPIRNKLRYTKTN